MYDNEGARWNWRVDRLVPNKTSLSLNLHLKTNLPHIILGLGIYLQLDGCVNE